MKTGQDQFDECGLEAFVNAKLGHPNMKTEQHCPVPPSAVADAAQALREDNERLRAEVAYLKKLQALSRSKQPAVPTKRV